MVSPGLHQRSIIKTRGLWYEKYYLIFFIFKISGRRGRGVFKKIREDPMNIN